MSGYRDESYPPVGSSLRYQRGDGLIVTVTVDYPSERDQPAVALAPPPELSPGTVLEGGNGASAVAVALRPGGYPIPADDSILDHPDVGGKLTAFILLRGADEFHSLHELCLKTFLETTPRNRIDLRVGALAIPDQSLELLQRHVSTGAISRVYYRDEPVSKYRFMRDMLTDPARPITTRWLLWFDDDSICDANPHWLRILAEQIAKYHRRDNVHMFGAKMMSTVSEPVKQILEQRPWYRRRRWRAANGQPLPYGARGIFVAGGFWALSREAVEVAQIPDADTGLPDSVGDLVIGEQLYQAGYNLRSFNAQRQFVRTGVAPVRRFPTP